MREGRKEGEKEGGFGLGGFGRLRTGFWAGLLWGEGGRFGAWRF